jgi:hypothetical protein
MGKDCAVPIAAWAQANCAGNHGRMVPIVRTAYDLSIAVRFGIAETNSRPLAPGLPNKTPHDPR